MTLIIMSLINISVTIIHIYIMIHRTKQSIIHKATYYTDTDTRDTVYT